jgi:type IV secretion system protein VirD4
MQVSGLDHRLHPGADAQRSACIEEMALNRSAGNADELADVRGEIAFAPKELKVAQDLSERLGFYTYAGRAQSRPSGLSSGRRSQTESDQRRALMLPQELIQMAPDRLLVLRAGLPAIRGRKIAYYRERAFIARLRPAPLVPARPLTLPPTPPDPAATISARRGAAGDRARDADLALVLPAIAAEGRAPIPEAGASPEDVEAWVAQFIDASARLPKGALDHGR